MKPTKAEAIRAIEHQGFLLVYPAGNAEDPASLWSSFYPRSKMRWEWDESGDDRVSRLWHLREELSRSRRVVYGKWYRGRVGFFSRDLYRALLALYSAQPGFDSLSPEARELLALLGENSPQSTKALKRATGLVGRALEPVYQRALKQLWIRLRIVGFGEVDEGAFPSLAVGASNLLFEDLVAEAGELAPAEAARIAAKFLSRSPAADRRHRSVLAALSTRS